MSIAASTRATDSKNLYIIRVGFRYTIICFTALAIGGFFTSDLHNFVSLREFKDIITKN
jgi:hypothetical protein